jgi:hypothetical protein
VGNFSAACDWVCARLKHTGPLFSLRKLTHSRWRFLWSRVWQEADSAAVRFCPGLNFRKVLRAGFFQDKDGLDVGP